MSADRLIAMVNQIAIAFQTLPTPEAVAATEDHLRKYWDPRMRARLVAVRAERGTGLSAIAAEAVARLADGTSS